MYYSLEPESEEEMQEWNDEYKIYFQVLGAVNMMLWAYVVRTEVYQLLALGQFKRYLDYFKSMWNWFDRFFKLQLNSHSKVAFELFLADTPFFS